MALQWRESGFSRTALAVLTLALYGTSANTSWSESSYLAGSLYLPLATCCSLSRASTKDSGTASQSCLGTNRWFELLEEVFRDSREWDM